MEETAQVTVWGDRFEVFLEHRPLLAGVPATLVIHVTDLVTFLPRSEGPLTFIARRDSGPPIEHTNPAPARAGIYTSRLTFPEAGEWKASLHIPGEGSRSAIDLPRLRVFASPEDAERSPPEEPQEGISFLKEQQWKVLMRTEPVKRQRLVERLRVPGLVSAPPGSRAAVTPPVAGRLLARAGRALPSLGDRVEAGEPLALVQPPFSEFGVKLVESRAEVVRSKLELDHRELVFARTRDLAAKNARSERELQEAELAVRSARASYEAAVSVEALYRKAGAIFLGPDSQPEKGTGLPAIELKAPIGGVVTEVRAAAGEHVFPENAVITILDTEKVFIEGRVPEADLGRLASSWGASYRRPDAPDRWETILGNGGGRKVFLGLEVDRTSRTVPLIYEVPNREGELRIGMALDLHLETEQAEEALAVPESAIVDEDGRAVAFAQVSGETFERRDLVPGIRDGGRVQVLSGLSEGERVVVQGAYAIRLASASGAVPAHGHSH